ncbi:MAG: YigZ family protein [Sporolactobacillus sp.]
MILSSYRTVRKKACEIAEIRRSRFIANVFPIKDEKEAEQAIHALTVEHGKANHHCFAYTVGARQEIQKASDDGEPSGTAGVPILDVLKRHHICHTLIVVTRYFGGIKLGAGGLIRAYAHCARAGLYAAEPIEQVPSVLWQLTADYPLQGTLENKLRESAYTIKDIHYTDQVTFEIYTRETESIRFRDWVIDLTNGQALLKKTAELYRQRTLTPEELNR